MGTVDQREEKREWGSGPFVHTFIQAMQPFVCISPYLFSEKPTPVDVSIVGRTTSNIVLMVVFSLPQSCCLEISF